MGNGASRSSIMTIEPSKPARKRQKNKIESYKEDEEPIPSKPMSNDEDDDYASFTM